MERVPLGAAEVVALAEGPALGQGSHERIDDVVDEHRLKASLWAGEGKDERDQSQQLGKAVGKTVVLPEDHRGPEAGDGETLPGRGVDVVLATAFGAQIMAGTVGGRVQRAHVQKAPYTRLLAGVDHLAAELEVGRLEATAVAAALVEDANQVDDHIRALEVGREHLGVVDVSLLEADRRQHQHVAMALAPPRDDLDAVAEGHQSPCQMSADEAGAADETDAERVCHPGCACAVMRSRETSGGRRSRHRQPRSECGVTGGMRWRRRPGRRPSRCS